MAAQDWAVVVGIRCYPGIGDLQGAENDANCFYDWVTSPIGGDVPPAQVARIRSSDFNPPAATALEAEPSAEKVGHAFDNLAEMYDARKKAGESRLGRRLYIYMAGHGFAPRYNDSALLTANATPTRAGHHILAQLYAEYFLRCGYFDEVLVFMDCCRENYAAPPNLPPYVERPAPGAGDKYLYAFGTKWSRVSREVDTGGGLYRGVFTQALLAGLTGGANRDGQITADSLKGYLKDNLKKFARPENFNDEDVQNPQVIVDDDFVIATMPVPKYSVTIGIANDLAGKELEIIDGDLHRVATHTADGGPWQIPLPRGLYVVQVIGQERRQNITVAGTGDVNVAL